jgi:lipopolysaccharide transport system ATP-binding protein
MRVIEVENISKLYRLGQIGTGSLSHDINRWWHKIRGKEDPYLKIGQVNKRDENNNASDFVWALKDIHFSVNEGEVVGIIGRNGAGKSTLLKLLSKITAPTTGQIRIKGRIAALLEVGTGFHPELTGRENIFLNGSILGMTKSEIKSKFDEIVDFAGVAKYVDTPVKRYSSGMIVRLGFAVAAHLEPEILIVDEVLAVGDADFQEKCINKMNSVSKQGRTVLFVSHNMTSVMQLCSRGILLENGLLTYQNDIRSVIDTYLKKNTFGAESSFDLAAFNSRTGSGRIKFTKLEIFNQHKPDKNFLIGDDMILHLTLESQYEIPGVAIAIQLYDRNEQILSNIENIDSDFIVPAFYGTKTFEISFKNLNFYPNTYKLGFWAGTPDGSETYDYIKFCADFNILTGSPRVKRNLRPEKGIVYITPSWKQIN